MTELKGFMLGEMLYESRHTRVFRAVWLEREDLHVIVKLLRRELPDVEETGRLRREYELLQKAGPEAVASPVALVKRGTVHALVVEDFGGDSLARLNVAGRLSFAELLGLALRVSGALQELHGKGIVHKDVNPANIVWNRKTDRVRLVDLNIASEVVPGCNAIPNAGAPEGTLAYMPPEQTGRINRSVDSRSDLYSLGATLFCLAAGHPPFQAADAMEMVHAHIALEPPSLASLRPDLPPALSRIIAKLLAKRPEDRYQTARGLSADFHHVLSQLEVKGEVPDFELGRRDLSDLFRIPEELFGRERERQALAGLWSHVLDSQETVVAMISGASGTGKSSLAQDLYSAVVARQGHFVAGAFSEANRNVPYASVVTAFSDLVRQLLASSRDKLERWRGHLVHALGETAAVLTEVLPDLELVVGPQPEPPELPANEAQNRFNYAIIQFVSAAANAEHPLVLFLDDLQWADPGSLHLLELIMTEPEVRNLMVLGAYRDGDVGQWHPLTGLLERARKSGTRVQQFPLEPLSEDAVRELLATTLSTTPAACSELAGMCTAKTAGNPFFLGQLLRSLHEKRLVWFAAADSRWQWDARRIAAQEITDNVVDLMTARIDRLSAEARSVLKLAACFGKSFSAAAIARTRGSGGEETYDRLYEMVGQGLVLHARGVGSSLSGASEGLTTSVVSHDFRFVHDRVLEAALSLLSPEEKQQLHLAIGRTLRSQQGDARQPDLFDVVTHFCLGEVLLTDPSERLDVARLNLAAARKARGALAVNAALECVRRGLNLLPDDRWDAHYETTLELHMLGAECCLLAADKEGMDQFGGRVLEHCRTVVEQVRVHELTVQYHADRRRPAKAVDACLAALRLLGIRLPRHPGIPQILLAFLRVRKVITGRPADHFASLPTMTDPAIGAAMRLIRAGSNSAFWSETRLIPLFGFKVAELTERHGVHPVSPWGLGGCAFVLAGPFGKWKQGVRLSEECMRLPGKFGFPESVPPATFVYWMFVAHWYAPLEAGLEATAAASLQAQSCGDVESASLCRHLGLVLAFWGGRELSACGKEAADCIRVHERGRQEWFRNSNLALWKCLTELTGDATSLEALHGSPFDLEAFQESSREVADHSALAMVHITRMAVGLFLGDVDAAERHGELAEEHLEAVDMSPYDAACSFYRPLTILAAARRDGALSRGDERRVRKSLATLSRYERTRSRALFAGKRLLVEAELATLRGVDDKTLARYEEAIQEARTHGRIHEEALACELAARALVALGMPRPALQLVAEAQHAYALWGAHRKAALLEAEYPELSGLRDSRTAMRGEETTTSSMGQSTDRGSTSLDLQSLLKSSRAISGEIVLDRLVEMMMRVVVENAGAQRGLFLLQGEEGWRLEAELDVNRPDLEGPGSLPLEHANRDRPRLALSIAHYVANTGKHVVLDDAAREGEYQGDEYIRACRPKSVLCTATRFRGDVGGIIYLENNDTTHAFTEERVHVLDVLTAQIAVSVENALLFKGKEDLISAYERFVPQEFLGHLEKKSILDVVLGDQVEREMTILFSDIRDFTTLSEGLSPAESFAFINSYLSRMEPVIRNHNGFIDKYVGDAIMALFSTHADDAVAAALDMISTLKDLNEERRGQNLPEVRIGVGLNSGRLMLGTVGGQQRMDGTVISDAVNLASRLEGMTKTFGATVLAGEHTYARLTKPDKYPHRPLGTVRVKGKSQPVTVYEFFGSEPVHQVALKLRSREDFAAAVRLYADNRFADAQRLFAKVHAENPADRAAEAYLRRCHHYRDGTLRAEEEDVGSV